MKKIILSLIVVAMIMAMTGCGSSKGFTYVENIDSISLAASRGLFDARIMPKDELTITVNTTNPEASAPFNLQSGEKASTAFKGYLVDNSGFINFPVIGKVHVVGLTKTECEDLIKSKIQPYLARTENPVVYGKRNNILLIREDAHGEKHAVRMNLNDANIINSPYYYLQQNDVLYVQPNSVKAKTSSIGSSTTIWFSFIGIVTSVASLLVNVLRK